MNQPARASTTVKQSAFFIRKRDGDRQQQQQQQQATATPPTPATSNILNIPGTRTSLQNSQLLTPIGIPSIDTLLGGGLPVGSVCLVGQDSLNQHSDVVTRCFLAEGVLHKHALYVADLGESEASLFSVCVT